MSTATAKPTAWAMSGPQRALYWRLWSNACEAQGWTSEKGFSREQIEGLRHETHRQVFGTAISAREITRTDGFGKIKARFEMLADSLDGAANDGHPDLDQDRRLRWVIGQQLMRLRLYVTDPLAYADKILRSRFNGGSTVDVPLLQDLRLHALDNLNKDLSRAVARFRSAAGDSEHVMNTRAKTRCRCAACRRSSGGENGR